MPVLTASPNAVPRVAVAPPVEVRTITRADIAALGALYFASYAAGVAAASEGEATADIEASFDGDYGELWLEASPCAEVDGVMVAAAMTVRQAPWDDVPSGPFIIELFTAPEWRRHGLAANLLGELAAVVGAAGSDRVSLRVAADNGPALSIATPDFTPGRSDSMPQHHRSSPAASVNQWDSERAAQ